MRLSEIMLCEGWSSGLPAMPESVNVDFLLPTGIVWPMKCCRDSTLDSIKRALWLQLQTGSVLFERLQARNDYILTTVCLGGGVDELYDESKRLCDIHLHVPVMRLVEPPGNQQERRHNHDIAFAIGQSLADFDETRDQELKDARCAYFEYADQAVKERRCEDGVDTYCLPIDSSLAAEDVAGTPDTHG